MKSFITLVRLNAEIHELLRYQPKLDTLCVLQAIFSYLGCSEKQTVLGTLHTMAVLAPIRAAWTHWLAPLPPKPIKNLCPCIVSPALGSLGAWLTERHMGLGYKKVLKKMKACIKSYLNTNPKYLTKNLLEGRQKKCTHILLYLKVVDPIMKFVIYLHMSFLTHMQFFFVSV